MSSPFYAIVKKVMSQHDRNLESGIIKYGAQICVSYEPHCFVSTYSMYVYQTLHMYYVLGSVYTYICTQPPRHYLFKGLCICERHYEGGQERVT